MKVIFIKDVKGTAKKDEIKDVSDGFALNYLLPNKLVVVASRITLHARQEQQARADKIKKVEQQEVDNIKNKLTDKTLILKAEAAPNGTLYAAIAPQIIVEAIYRQYQLEISPEVIVGAHNVKHLGGHSISLKLKNNQIINFNIKVEGK